MIIDISKVMKVSKSRKQHVLFRDGRPTDLYRCSGHSLARWHLIDIYGDIWVHAKVCHKKTLK